MVTDQFLNLADSVNILRFVVQVDNEARRAFSDENTIVNVNAAANLAMFTLEIS